MDESLDFTRWTEPPLGVGWRRWAITSTGLRQIFRGRFFRLLLFFAWMSGVLTAAAGFVFSQSVVTDGWIEHMAESFGPRAEAIASAFTGFILLYPDIFVEGTYTALLWGQSNTSLLLSLIALTVIVPGLITRDRASSALTIYLSRPLTSFDYLIGKFGIVVGVLLAVWTGPLLFGWLLSVLFAPESIFITYSLLPLGRALLFNAIGVVVLGAVAFGVSAAAKTTVNTVLLWIGLWMGAGTLAKIPFLPGIVRGMSFTHDLDQIGRAVFQGGDVLSKASAELALFNASLAQGMKQVSTIIGADNIAGAVAGLVVLVALSSIVFLRRLRPE
jgi:ABC-2 type transport system permease protein